MSSCFALVTIAVACKRIERRFLIKKKNSSNDSFYNVKP